MTKLMDRCRVAYETEPEKNGWYTLDNKDFDELFKCDMMSVSDLIRMAQVVTEKAGEYDEQLEDFSNLDFEEGCPVELDLVAADTYEKYVGFAVGPVEYRLEFKIKKSKLESIEASIFLGLNNGFISVSEIPGVLSFKFLQCYAKYLLGELEEKEWVDTDYRY